MYNTENDNLRTFYPVDDQPAHVDRLPVDFCFCRDLPALPECQGIFLNAIDGLEYFITDPDGGYWLMLDVSDVAGDIVDVLKSVIGDP